MPYLDHAATSPLLPSVAELLADDRIRSLANAGSVHRAGQRARARLDTDREVFCAELGAEPREIVFTSSGTEANNLAIKGFAMRVRRETDEWPTIVTDGAEHHAVLHPVEYLEELGAPVVRVPVDRVGRVTVDAVRNAIDDLSGPFLVSIMHANNEVGTINPIGAIAAVVHEHGGVMHSDAVQSFGKMTIAPKDLGIDLLSISAHKIGGPRGIGALYAERTIEFDPQLHGGSQERDRRAGTEPVDLVAGFAEALRYWREHRSEIAGRLDRLRTRLLSGLRTIDGVIVTTPSDDALSTILNITFSDAEHLDGEGLIVGMDIRGIAVSNGSACTSGSMQPSHVLASMGYPPAQSRAVVRFSTGWSTTEEDVDRGVEGMREVVGGMREH